MVRSQIFFIVSESGWTDLHILFSQNILMPFRRQLFLFTNVGTLPSHLTAPPPSPPFPRWHCRTVRDRGPLDSGAVPHRSAAAAHQSCSGAQFAAPTVRRRRRCRRRAVVVAAAVDASLAMRSSGGGRAEWSGSWRAVGDGVRYDARDSE